MVCNSCSAKKLGFGAPSLHGSKCGCPSCNVPDQDVQMFGGGFGTGITSDQSGQSFLGGKQIVSWMGDTPVTYDPHTGQAFVNILNMNTGQYMPGVAMPTTIAARGGGYGPIATAPTGSGRAFWAPDITQAGSLLFMAGVVTLFVGGLYLMMNVEIERMGREAGAKTSRGEMTRGTYREGSHLIV